MENKSVTNTAKFILNIWNIGLFVSVWISFYNSYAFETYKMAGALITILVYAILYTSLCKLYKAHRIASSEIGETVFSQVISFGMTDIILYVECCLVYNRYVNILPGAVTAVLQIIGTAFIVMWTKQFLIKYIPPKNTVIVYGKDSSESEVKDFRDRLLKKYSHLFSIPEIVRELPADEKGFWEFLRYDVVILYEVSSDLRGNYIDLLIDHKKTFYIENCNFIKFVLMLCVVLYHSIVFWSGTWFTKNPVFQSDLLKIFSQWLNSFHIYGFTLISGYLFAYLRNERGKYRKFANFFCNKVKRLVVPYVFVCIGYVIPIYCIFFRGSKKEILRRFVFAESPNQLWFLWMLFDVFILFWFLNDFFFKQNLCGIILVIMLYGIGILGSNLFPNIFQIWTACSYVVFFWTGFKLRQYQDKLKKTNYCLLWVVLDVLIFVSLQYMPKDGLVFSVLTLGMKLSLYIVGALMSFFVLNKLADKIDWKKRRVIKQLSDFSMPIYLFHQQIIYFSIYFFNGRVNPYINALLNFIIAMVVSVIISALLMKNKITRFAIGEK